MFFVIACKYLITDWPFKECPDFTGLALGLDNCFTAFIVLGIGALSGCILLVCECCSRLTSLNLKILESYDRGDNLMDEIDHLDIRTLIQIKDAVIEELAEEVTASRVNKKQLKADSH